MSLRFNWINRRITGLWPENRQLLKLVHNLKGIKEKKTIMKIFYVTLFVSALVLASCNANQEKNTERTVVDRDTVSSETEYEIENRVREKTVTIDTVTEKETVTTEEEYDEEGQIVPRDEDENEDR
jgi:hypothetical protein